MKISKNYKKERSVLRSVLIFYIFALVRMVDGHEKTWVDVGQEPMAMNLAAEKDFILNKNKRIKTKSESENMIEVLEELNIDRAYREGVVSSTFDQQISEIEDGVEGLDSQSPRDKRASTDTEITTYRKMVMEIAIYLQHHKYFDYDHRFETMDEKHKKKVKAKLAAFVHRFPVPPLRKLTPHVKKACEKGFHDCVRHIAHYAVATHIYKFMVTDVNARAVTRKMAPFRFLAAAKKDIRLNHQPFPSMLQLFQFRTTASYYMCWYTMEKLKILERFPGPCNYWWEKEYRATNQEDFACALYSFCPDICCSHVEGGILYFTDADKCKKSEKNPCHGIMDGACLVDFQHNRDFKAMTKNRMNITCKCHEKMSGYKWSNRFGICIDEDECYEGNNTCGEHEACYNALGSYGCACARGYETSKDGTEECVRRKDMDFSAVEEEDKPLPTPPSKWKKAERIIDKVYGFFLSKFKNGAESTQVHTASLQILIAALSGLWMVHIELC